MSLLRFPTGPNSSSRRLPSPPPCAASWSRSEAEALLGNLLDGADLCHRLAMTERGRETEHQANAVEEHVLSAASNLRALLTAVSRPPAGG